ncbi:hypothetical protein GR11A_00128 [Vibrio phage vB_VcorM_GR11A]|nr:hypothetical protein GR11A_00128 [Vibrio phage vB_VcorM_GR11A]
MALPNGFSSLKFIPQSLQDRPLYEKVCSLIDLVAEADHYRSMDIIKDHYRFGTANYSDDKIVEELGGLPIRETLKDVGAAFDDKAFPQFMDLLFSVKGTTRGLELVLGLIGIEVTVYDSFRVNREIRLNTPLGQEYAANPDLNSLEECDVLLEIQSATFDVNQVGVEEKLQALAEVFFWVCANVKGFLFSVLFENRANVTTTLEIDFDPIDVIQPYGVGRHSLERTAERNLIGEFVIGSVLIGDIVIPASRNVVNVGYWDELEIESEFEFENSIIPTSTLEFEVLELEFEDTSNARSEITEIDFEIDRFQPYGIAEPAWSGFAVIGEMTIGDFRIISGRTTTNEIGGVRDIISDFEFEIDNEDRDFYRDTLEADDEFEFEESAAPTSELSDFEFDIESYQAYGIGVAPYVGTYVEIGSFTIGDGSLIVGGHYTTNTDEGVRSDLSELEIEGGDFENTEVTGSELSDFEIDGGDFESTNVPTTSIELGDLEWDITQDYGVGVLSDLSNWRNTLGTVTVGGFIIRSTSTGDSSINSDRLSDDLDGGLEE